MVYISDTKKTQNRLENFELELIKSYIRDEDPNYALFFKHVLRMLDKYSVNESKEDCDNSLYANLTNIIRFMHVDELPIDNDKILEAFRDDYASTLDFRTKNLDVALEDFRNILKEAVPLYGMKSNSKARDYYIRLCDEYTYGDTTKKFNIDLFFHRNGFDITNMPPEFDNISKRLNLTDITSTFQVGDEITGSVSGASATISNVYTDRTHVYLDASTVVGTFEAGDAITGSLSSATATVSEFNEDTIIYSEIPVYEYNATTDEVDLNTAEEFHKGNRPFEYQLVAGLPDFNISGLFRYVQKNFKPAGYSCWVFVKIDDIVSELITTPLCLPKIYLHTSYPDIKVVTSATEGYDAGEFPPVEWAKQGIPIYISGTVSVPYGTGGSFTDEYIEYVDGAWVDSADPDFTWELISVNSDFPLPYSDASGVRNGETYIIAANVTDNDATKTNTGQSFTAHRVIQWYGDDSGAWY